jgi:type IV pilus assembly protein PilN
VIRVNLLPHKRAAAKEEQSQAWVFVLMGVLAIEAIALFFFHQTKANELARQRQRNTEITQQIDEIKKTVANHTNVKSQLGVFRQREEAILKLQSARTGPTAVLLEVAKVLTQGRGPTVDPDKLAQLRKDNPLAVPNSAWDARRTWLLGYKESDRTVTIEGLARDGEDVSELARRLALSNYFMDVKLLPASRVKGEKGLEMLKFQLQSKVRYLWPPLPPKAAQRSGACRCSRRSGSGSA